ncbi:MAG: hypothetical protein GY861_20740 [bacterium]|nr:hypothetical protein [bacterium]
MKQKQNQIDLHVMFLSMIDMFRVKNNPYIDRCVRSGDLNFTFARLQGRCSAEGDIILLRSKDSYDPLATAENMLVGVLKHYHRLNGKKSPSEVTIRRHAKKMSHGLVLVYARHMVVADLVIAKQQLTQAKASVADAEANIETVNEDAVRKFLGI